VNERDRLIAWYLETPEPGAAAEYLQELVEETYDDNYLAIIERMKAMDGYSPISLLLYLDEIATPDRKALLPHLEELETVAAGSRWEPLVANLRQRLGVSGS